jgi:hypothetical protein
MGSSAASRSRVASTVSATAVAACSWVIVHSPACQRLPDLALHPGDDLAEHLPVDTGRQQLVDAGRGPEPVGDREPFGELVDQGVDRHVHQPAPAVRAPPSPSVSVTACRSASRRSPSVRTATPSGT